MKLEIFNLPLTLRDIIIRKSYRSFKNRLLNYIRFIICFESSNCIINLYHFTENDRKTHFSMFLKRSTSVVNFFNKYEIHNLNS